MTVILHITPHLGGGVGKALSSLVMQDSTSTPQASHIIACLEVPEKTQFLDKIQGCGCEVYVAPDLSCINRLVATADIIQLEWWNHPATIECLCHMDQIPMRLIVWCHVSGLNTPIIPRKLMEYSDKFIFTSRCSYEAPNTLSLDAQLQRKLSVVSSGGGFSHLPLLNLSALDPLAVGYMGSLNFAKLHPQYVEFLASVNIENFEVRMVGDTVNSEVLDQQAAKLDRAGMFDFRGYNPDAAKELQDINVLAYLLNPQHYGTAENALLEAMAMGIVPVVLDNLAECQIVEDGHTGYIVRSPKEFASKVEWLSEHPEKRCRIGMQAAESVRKRFTPRITADAFYVHYSELQSKPKHLIPFEQIFGTTHEEWFLSCQGETDIFQHDGSITKIANNFSIYGLLEKTKGSANHFSNHFHKSKTLAGWARHLNELNDDILFGVSK